MFKEIKVKKVKNKKREIVEKGVLCILTSVQVLHTRTLVGILQSWSKYTTKGDNEKVKKEF
jgi:hypothetical protein